LEASQELVSNRELTLRKEISVLSNSCTEIVLSIDDEPADSRTTEHSTALSVGLYAVADQGKIVASVAYMELLSLSDLQSTITVSGVAVPEAILHLSRPGILRDFRVVQVFLNPYLSMDGTDYLIRRAVIRVENWGGTGENERMSDRRAISPLWDRIYRQCIVNYEAQDLPHTWTGTGPRYIVISRSRFDQEVTQLVEWKRIQGYGVDLVTLEDLGFTDPTSEEAMDSTKAYIAHAYFNWEVKPEFVLLVGDISDGDPDGSIWTKKFYNPLWGQGWRYYDQWYAFVDGDDTLPDIMIGRIPDENIERMNYMLAKTVDYEKNPNIDGTWQKNALMTVTHPEPDHPTVQTKEFVSDLLADWGMSVTERFQEQATPAQIIPVINLGLTFYNYRAQHSFPCDWSGTFTADDVAYVNNVRKLGLWTVLGCNTAAFHHSSTTTAELLLRHGYTDPSNPKGAVALIGSQAGTWYEYSNALDKGIYTAFTDMDATLVGEALLLGLLWACDNSAPGDTQDIMMKEFVILGDPSLQVWTDVPSPMVVVLDPQTIPVGQTTDLLVSATYETSEPIGDALVCLSRDSDIYVYGYTDGSGAVTLPLSPTSEGEVNVTVTACNTIPHLGLIDVVGPCPPEEPGILTVEADQAGSVLLSWADVTEGTCGTPVLVDHYEIHRSSNAYFQVGDDTLIGTTPDHEFTDIDALPGDTDCCYYRIVAVSDGGMPSAASATVGAARWQLIE
jgi:hypothetical protein